MKSLLVVVLMLAVLVLAAAPMAAQLDGMDLTRYIECESALVMVQPFGSMLPAEMPVESGETTPAPARFVEIFLPTDGMVAATAALLVEGQAGGAFENNVVIHVLDGEGNLLAERPVTTDAPEVGGVGSFMTEFVLDVAAGTPLTVTAFLPPVVDGEEVTIFDTVDFVAGTPTGAPARFVEIIRPFDGMGTHTHPLVVSGLSAGAFENNIVIQVLDSDGNVLAEQPTTSDAQEVGGMGAWSTEIQLEAEPGTVLTVTAFMPPVADGEVVTISDSVSMVISPLARPLSSLLIIQPDDPILASDDPCSEVGAAMTSTDTMPVVINNVMAFQTMSLPPHVNVSIEAAKPSVCPLPLRARMTEVDAVYTIEVYFDTAEMAPCTRDLRPFNVTVPLGIVEAPSYSIIVNGETVQ